MDKEICFPALVISDSKIDRINYRYLVCDKRYINLGYKNVLIIDSEGYCFDVQRVVQSGGISLWYSLKLIGLLVRVKPVLKKQIFVIPLTDFRDRLIEIVKRHPRNFSSLDTAEPLIERLKRSPTYLDIINIF